MLFILEDIVQRGSQRFDTVRSRLPGVTCSASLKGLNRSKGSIHRRPSRKNHELQRPHHRSADSLAGGLGRH
jgi:hypothetical protein